MRWSELNTEREAAKRILDTGEYRGTLPPDDSVLREFVPEKKSLRVLDMCCGIGRNTVWIRRNRPECETWGFDLPNMTRLAESYSSRNLAGPHGINFTSKLDDIKDFDLVICMLSFQHIPINVLDKYYPLLSNAMSGSSHGMMLVNGRDWSDHNGREFVWTRLRRHFRLDRKHSLSRSFLEGRFDDKNDHHMGVFRPMGWHRLLD